jgi:hypothetical protein
LTVSEESSRINDKLMHASVTLTSMQQRLSDFPDNLPHR